MNTVLYATHAAYASHAAALANATASRATLGDTARYAMRAAHCAILAAVIKGGYSPATRATGKEEKS